MGLRGTSRGWTASFFTFLLLLRSLNKDFTLDVLSHREGYHGSLYILAADRRQAEISEHQIGTSPDKLNVDRILSVECLW